MYCHKAELLINRYLKDKLDTREMVSFKDHLAICKSCSSSLKIAKALLEEQGLQPAVKAPGGFTEDVMSAVFSLEADKKAHPTEYDQKGWSMAYRRLGFSLVLTAGIIVFSFLVPAFRGYSGVISTPAPQNDNTSGYIDVFTGLDSGVKGIFENINKSVIDFKGGTDNEL